MYDLGPRLKELRMKRGYTQESLGKKINKSKSAISSYEKDLQLPPLEVAVDIATMLNVSLDTLLGLGNEEYISTKNLTTPQKDLLDLILTEFISPGPKGPELSSLQIEIIQKLILLFQDIK